MRQVAVILCGSGFKDGSEIRESVGLLWALSAQGAQAEIFAPDEPQHDVVNCLEMKVAKGEQRNMLVEAARIARGKIRPLQDLRSEDFDALMIPGGFGVAKNLCDFALRGSQGSVHPLVQKAIQSFFVSGKAIGAICIAPVLVAMTLKNKNLELSVGAHSEVAQEIEKLGHRHFVTAAHECHVDRLNKIVTTPAYMEDSAPLHQIFEGIQKSVQEVLSLAV